MNSGRIGTVVACMLCVAFAPPARARDVRAVPRTQEGPWLHEAQFASDRALHALPGQTVILDLERRRRRFVVNDVRIVLDRAIDFALCVPSDARYVRRVRLKAARRHGTRKGATRKRARKSLRIRRGGPCEPVRLRPGAYRIRVIHEGRAVPPGGQAAFLRSSGPRSSQGALLYTVDASGCPGCDLTGADLTGQQFPGADFSRATFAKAKLDGADFASARFDDASLVSASVVGTNLSDTYLSCANLSGLALGGLFQPARQGAVYEDGGAESSLVRVDPATGVRTTVTGRGLAGVTYYALVDVTTLSDGGLLTADLFDPQSAGDSTVYRVDPARGGRTLVSNNSMGTGPAFGRVWAVREAIDGSYLVYGNAGQSGPPAIFQVDPATGDRRIISGAGTGSGPDLGLFGGFAVDKDGSVIAPASATTTLVRVDPATGDRTVVTGSGTGSGTTLSYVKNVLLTSAGSLVVSDADRLVSVDPATGARSVLSSSTVGRGPLVRDPFGVVEDDDGSLLMVDVGIVRVDPRTGDRTVVSSSSVGGGAALGGPLFLTSFPVGPTIAPDFSCRLDLHGATLAVATFALEDWRYMDLTGATIGGAAGATLSSEAAPLDLSGAILSGVDLSGTILDFVNFGCFAGVAVESEPCPAASGTPACTTLQGTNLAKASLMGACLAGAGLQGASLSESNLAGADLSSAQLLGLPSGTPATLAGAFMPDAILHGADLTGVNANYVAFYSATATADATNATMTGARFTNAYLAGADFGQATAESTAWTQSVLVGASFDSAHLEKNATADEATDFSGAYLQGASFTNATVTDADFTSSYWDLTGSATLVIQMPQQSLEFTGYWNSVGAPECVAATYDAPSVPPITTSTNFCPNGAPGSCAAVWEMPTTPIDQAVPRSAVYPALPVNPTSQCTTTDLFWQVGGL